MIADTVTAKNDALRQGWSVDMAEHARQWGLSVEEYLRGERDGELRHEFINGEVYAMTGESRAHNTVAGNVFAWFREKGGPRGCEIFIGDVKVRINEGGDERYYYPDVVAVCEQDDADDYFVERPCLIVEVLSPRTERNDRSDKFFAYRRLPSMQEMVLIAQDTQRVEVYRRRTGWDLEVYGADTGVPLDCVDGEVAVSAVYAGVVIDEPSASID